VDLAKREKEVKLIESNNILGVTIDR